MNIDDNLDLLPPSVVNSIKAGNPRYTKPVDYIPSKSTTLPKIKTRAQPQKSSKVSLGNVGEILGQMRTRSPHTPHPPCDIRPTDRISTKYNSYADCVKGLINSNKSE